MTRMITVYLARTIATVCMWGASMWMLVETSSNGGTIGWITFFMVLATCAVWSDDIIIGG